MLRTLGKQRRLDLRLAIWEKSVKNKKAYRLENEINKLHFAVFIRPISLPILSSSIKSRSTGLRNHRGSINTLSMGKYFAQKP